MRLFLLVICTAMYSCAPMDAYRSRLLTPEAAAAPGVYVTWMGTAGVLVSDGKTGILIDPYVSRFGLARVFLGMTLPPDHDLISQWAGNLGAGAVQAVVVSHSHFDHALDAPYFAREAGAPLMGSESTRNIGLGAGLPESMIEVVKPGRDISVGDFTLRFIESRHGPALFGKVPYPGTIDQPLAPPKRAGEYKLGATYAILIRHPAGTILHHGSAGFLPGMYEGVQADVVLLGIAGRGDTGAYLAEVPLKVKARMVVPIHFDDFFQPLDKGLSFLYTAHFSEFCIAAQAHALSVRTVPIGGKVRILPLD
jgi:L-ascorbate metabolism protein UlaG (beta-lactamase superfamily)